MTKATRLIADDELLIDVLTDELREAGHPNPAAWQVGLPKAELIDKPHRIQQFFINRHLRHYFGLLSVNQGVDTKTARYCLIDDCKASDWLRSVKEGVVPAMVKFDTMH